MLEEGKINKINNIVKTIFFRLEEYLKSVEFNHILNVPPDFFIEFYILNFHVWVILNRLKDFRNDYFV